MKLSLISDFNLETLALYLRKSLGVGADVVVAPFGQVAQCLLDFDSNPNLWEPSPEACLIWTRPEAVLPSVKASLQGLPTSLAELEKETDSLVELILRAAGRTRFVFLATWALPFQHAGGGLNDLNNPVGPTRMVMAANSRLVEAFGATSNVFLLDAGKWLQKVGEAAFSPRHWYGAKVPYANDVFKAATHDLIAALENVQGAARKLLIVDLDDTLWGGLVGEIGWENIVLGGHDPFGEALVDFQQELKALTRRGVALGIVSKNTEATALEAIDRHPEMVLRRADFAGWRINWNDKAQNIVELAQELRLSLDSVVFIDDNPAERARVRDAFPQILVPEWPTDKRFYSQALLALACFDKPALTEEDQRRAQLYAQERERSATGRHATSMDDWVAGLQMEVTITQLDKGNLPRMAQLLNKTNQMNLSTRRLSETELWGWAAEREKTRVCWGFRLRDRFGDSGLTGVLSLDAGGEKAWIVDFILSCRVMGRRVERIMLQTAVEWAAQRGLTQVQARYLPTEKNQPCLAFFQESGFHAASDGLFLWNAETPYNGSSLIQLSRPQILNHITSEQAPIAIHG